MEASIIAYDRGHKVTLVEKTDSLGGLLKFADTDAYKKDLGSFKDVLVRRVMKRRINVLLGKEVTPEDIASYSADAIILAIGSEPVVPPIRGVEDAIRALDIYDDMSKVGKNVIMVGGGLVGCEVGLHLAKNGRDVTIVEMLDSVAQDSYKMHRIGLINEMDRMLTYRTGLKCISIKSDGITVVDRENREQFMSADTVIYAVGMEAKKKEAGKLRSAIKDAPVYEIGDCVNAAKVYEAVRQGFIAAMSIL